MLTLTEAKQYYSYDPETGEVFSKKRNRVVRHNTSHRGKQYRPYQVAFILMTGILPESIDHKDGNTKNDKWDNLREATGFQQSANTRKKGVYQAESGKFYYQLAHEGTRYYKGGYKSYEEAQAAHKALCEKLQGEFSISLSRG